MDSERNQQELDPLIEAQARGEQVEVPTDQGQVDHEALDTRVSKIGEAHPAGGLNEPDPGVVWGA